MVAKFGLAVVFPMCAAMVVLLSLLVACGGGETPIPTPTPPGGGEVTDNISVSVSPKRASAAASGQTRQFTATVSGDSQNLGVTWAVDGIAGGKPASEQ